jgi:hypothetical protein
MAKAYRIMSFPQGERISLVSLAGGRSLNSSTNRGETGESLRRIQRKSIIAI